MADVLWRDVKRNQQPEALKLSSASWTPEHHPELVKGGGAYVDEIGSELMRDSRMLSAETRSADELHYRRLPDRGKRCSA